MTSALHTGSVVLELATWNIGGGILGASHQRGGTPSPDYYASVLRRHAPDVVCLQEAHVYSGSRESQPHYLARQAGYPHVEFFPISASHLTGDADFALAVLSRFPITYAVYRQFPNPGRTGTGPGGEPWTLDDKGYLITRVDLGNHEIGLINGHCFPLRHFGACATDPEFAESWSMLARDMLALRDSGPALAAVDLNHDPIEDVLSAALGRDRYLNAFPGGTAVKGAKRDHVLYGLGMRLLSAMATATESDHAYRQVRFLVEHSGPDG